MGVGVGAGVGLGVGGTAVGSLDGRGAWVRLGLLVVAGSVGADVSPASGVSLGAVVGVSGTAVAAVVDAAVVWAAFGLGDTSAPGVADPGALTPAHAAQTIATTMGTPRREIRDRRGPGVIWLKWVTSARDGYSWVAEASWRCRTVARPPRPTSDSATS